MIKTILIMAVAKGPPFDPSGSGVGSGSHEMLMGLAGIVCGALLIYAILSQL